MGNIVLWYDTVDNGVLKNNLQQDGYVFSNISAILPALLVKNKIDFIIATTVYGSEYFYKKYSNLKSFYPIEIGHYNSRENTDIFPIDKFWFFKKINENVEILIWYPNEGWLFTRNNETMNRLINLIHTKYPLNPIRFIFGDFHRPDNIPSYVNYKCFKNFFWYDTVTRISQVPLVSNKDSKYDFITLNRRLRISRYMVFTDLKNSGMLEKAFYTNMMITEYAPPTLYDQFNTFKKLYTVKEDDSFCTQFDADIFSNVDSLKSTNKQSPVRVNLPELDLTNCSYLELVNETFFDSTHNLFITEKTYRSIAMGHIFLICGQQGTLAHLKHWGFQTFDDLFDESYDQYTSFSQRWAIIKKNLQLWISMSDVEKKSYYMKSFDKLVHNQNLLYNRNFKTEIQELFKD